MEEKINQQEADRLVQSQEISDKFSPEERNCFDFEFNTR